MELAVTKSSLFLVKPAVVTPFIQSPVSPFVQLPIPRKCPNCDTKSKNFFHDYSRNETVCRGCGLVLGNCPRPAIEKEILFGGGKSHTNRGMFGKNLGSLFNAFQYSNKTLKKATNYERKRRLNIVRDLTRRSLEEPVIRKLLGKASRFTKQIGLEANNEFFDYFGFILRETRYYRAYSATQIVRHAVALAIKKFYPDKLNGEVLLVNGKKRGRGRPRKLG